MITWQRYWVMVIIRLGMLRYQGFTTWKDLDTTYSPLGNNLYTVSWRYDGFSPICLLSKASKTKSWLWHRRLSHLNFGAINHLARHGLVRGLPKLKFEKDHLCSACAMGKSKKKSHTPKSEDTNQEKLYLLHMDLCGPIRVASVNGKNNILIIVDDYLRFTWVKYLRSNDEARDFIIKFLKMIQERLKVHVRRIRTDNGTKFVNQTLREYYEKVSYNRRLILVFSLATPFHKEAFQIYNRRTRRIIETIHVDFDELTAMASEHISSGPALHEMTHATISSGLVPNSPPLTSFVPPLRTDCDILFQPMFDELLTPPPSVDYLAPEVIAPITDIVTPEPAASTGSHSSTTVDQYAPSPTSSFCYYDAFLTAVEPKTYKDALTQSCCIEAMKEELHEFESLKVWELIPLPDKVMVITLKWIYKVKLDEGE
ncbi:retrovirus-related pol polyprotein from transposon TNT 1-94, partial [Tanacetum coccineum]